MNFLGRRHDAPDLAEKAKENRLQVVARKHIGGFNLSHVVHNKDRLL
jgi:hypothetical protein